MKQRRTCLRRHLVKILEYLLMGDDEERPVIQRALKALKMRPVWRKGKWRLVADRAPPWPSHENPHELRRTRKDLP